MDKNSGSSTSLGHPIISKSSLQKIASTTGEQFQKLYYDTMDKRRHLVSKLYMDSAVLSWNGHGMTNATDIHNFYTTLASTTHCVASFDSIPIPSIAVGTQQAVVVHVAGNVRLKSDATAVSKVFTQSFILTQHQDKWKIVSDIYRTQHAADALTL